MKWAYFPHSLCPECQREREQKQKHVLRIFNYHYHFPAGGGGGGGGGLKLFMMCAHGTSIGKASVCQCVLIKFHSDTADRVSWKGCGNFLTCTLIDFPPFFPPVAMYLQFISLVVRGMGHLSQHMLHITGILRLWSSTTVVRWNLCGAAENKNSNCTTCSCKLIEGGGTRIACATDKSVVKKHSSVIAVPWKLFRLFHLPQIYCLFGSAVLRRVGGGTKSDSDEHMMNHNIRYGWCSLLLH